MNFKRRITVMILACLVLGIGGVTIGQYISGHAWESAWTGQAPMASPTALALVLIASALIILSHHNDGGAR
jgi:hypothetical protein